MWMIIGIFFLMLLIGVPVAFGVGISSMLYLALNGKDLVILTQRIFAGGDSFTLMAIPLFIFAGEIMNACGVTKRIVGFANELVGFIPGGLAHVNILASMLFAGAVSYTHLMLSQRTGSSMNMGSNSSSFLATIFAMGLCTRP